MFVRSGVPPDTAAIEGTTSSPENRAFFAAFVASLHSTKASLLCKPRPKDFGVDELRAAVGEIMEASSATSAAELSPSGKAIDMLLYERWGRCKFVGASGQRQRPGAVENSGLSACSSRIAEISWERVMGTEPDAMLQCLPAEDANGAVVREPILAFHGAPFENIWSILNIGFVNAAQVDGSLGRHGHARSLFGKGIYLSLDPGYAASFVRPSSPLPHSLGRWRCLLLCEVAPGPMVTIGGKAANGDYVGMAAREAQGVPEGVVVVEDSDAITVRCAFFWSLPESGSMVSLEMLVASLIAIASILYFVWSHSKLAKF